MASGLYRTFKSFSDLPADIGTARLNSNQTMPYGAYGAMSGSSPGGAGGADEYGEQLMAADQVLSPDEWDQAPREVRSQFGSYNTYLNAWQSRRKAKYDRAQAYTAAQNFNPETFQTPSYAVRAYKTISEGGKTGAGASKGVQEPSVAPTRHVDITGRVSQDLTGQGVERGLGGDIKPLERQVEGVQNAAVGQLVRGLGRETAAATAQSEAQEAIFRQQQGPEAGKQAQAERALRLREGSTLTRSDKLAQEANRIASRKNLQEERLAHQKTLLEMRQKFVTTEGKAIFDRVQKAQTEKETRNIAQDLAKLEQELKIKSESAQSKEAMRQFELEREDVALAREAMITKMKDKRLETIMVIQDKLRTGWNPGIEKLLAFNRESESLGLPQVELPETP